MSCDNNHEKGKGTEEGYPWMTEEEYLGSDVRGELPISYYEFEDGCIVLVGLTSASSTDSELRLLPEEDWDGSHCSGSEDYLDDIPF